MTVWLLSSYVYQAKLTIEKKEWQLFHGRCFLHPLTRWEDRVLADHHSCSGVENFVFELSNPKCTRRRKPLCHSQRTIFLYLFFRCPFTETSSKLWSMREEDPKMRSFSCLRSCGWKPLQRRRRFPPPRSAFHIEPWYPGNILNLA